MLAAFFSQDRVRAAFRGGQLGTYLAVLAAGSGARVFGLASQFIVLIILNRILSKDSFGDMMIAFGFYRLIGIAFGIGASLVLIYHVSRHPNDRTAEIRLHRYSAVISAAAAALVALAGFVLAGPIAHALAKPGLEAWFRELAPFGIFTVLLVTSTGALEGRSRITESIALGEAAPNAVRMVLLPAVALAGLPSAYVAHAMTVSVLLPWLWSARSLCDRSVVGWRPWTSWDLSYCGKYVAATLFANQLGAVDILVAGMLFPSEVVADYAVAARIAALYSFFQIALLKRFAPRAAHMIQTKDVAAVRQEYVFCRKLMVGCSALNIAGILCVGPFLLPLFGNYAGAGSFLVWLAIHAFMHSFFATSDRLLLIAGQANVSLTTTASTFAMLVTTPFVTAPFLGPTAIPVTMALATALLYPLAARVKTLFDVRTFEPRDLLLIGAGIIVLVSYAITGAAMWGIVSVSGLSAIAFYYCRSAIRRTGA
ncbi:MULTISPECIES: lipopolysaccharide biosynthesis protein [unclassified Bradyrhizobium]|uniref:lipopolysaccharide biosynthesis protein n=1 Tax=unclassified Bradyrhizobium TaxID=2631580 RepID=UPI001BA4F4EF|nr:MULTISPECIES: oligosaccharide flippase family protein [unclassified Bradyrhizobium]MBR1229040.1 oligosaccharide flippase family protein [Bradyrhizobium sp. AUGA SZCCT0176]MBR1299025.1 oligosaccharide flippase family protein [Bradyrhizobium sp. AUGA SZCCT0042]